MFIKHELWYWIGECDERSRLATQPSVVGASLMYDYYYAISVDIFQCEILHIRRIGPALLEVQSQNIQNDREKKL